MYRKRPTDNMIQSITITILLPIFPKHDTVYFRGYISAKQEEIIIYITEYTTNYEDIARKQFHKEDVLYGYCSDFSMSHYHVNVNKISENILVLEKQDVIRIKRLEVQRRRIEVSEGCIIMLYDHKKFKSSETISDLNDQFSKLQFYLEDNQLQAKHTHSKPNLKLPHWMSSSMFAQHLLNYFNLINWLFATLRQDKKVSIKLGNLILAIITDVAMGFVILELLAQDKKAFSIQLMSVLENLVNMMYTLLRWLMGSPAGLKLNNAFNKLLGKYFSYHIQLWWLFLDISGEKLDIILQVYHSLGYFGLTFQAAIVSDLICIATFHSYCIYVYAARLFNIQVSGLIALMRLFVGRKHNPLRGGVDSCEYTNQELFVGTVAFTILLLLLPTTTMYYIVFTLFRLLSLGVQHILAEVIYIIQTLPLYVLSLWLIRSPKVAGNILLQVENNEEGAPLVLRVKLFNKSLQELVTKCRPPVQALEQIEWTNVLSNVFRGKQIV